MRKRGGQTGFNEAIGTELKPACLVFVVENSAFTNLSKPFRSANVLEYSNPRKMKNSNAEISTKLSANQRVSLPLTVPL